MRYLPSYLPEMRRKKNVFLCHKVTVVTRKMVEKLRMLRKNIFGKSLAKYTQRFLKNQQKQEIKESVFKYGSLRLNDLSSARSGPITPALPADIRCHCIEKLIALYSSPFVMRFWQDLNLVVVS